MNRLVMVLGSSLLATLILSIPAFVVLSLVLHWHIFIQILLIALCVIEYFTLYAIILSESE